MVCGAYRSAQARARVRTPFSDVESRPNGSAGGAAAAAAAAAVARAPPARRLEPRRAAPRTRGGGGASRRAPHAGTQHAGRAHAASARVRGAACGAAQRWARSVVCVRRAMRSMATAQRRFFGAAAAGGEARV
jgi:hypothetical protein